MTQSASSSFVPRPLRNWAPYFILLVAVLAAYGNIYDNSFLYDDESLILKNLFLRDWHSFGSIFTTSITAGANIAGGFYRPLQISLYWIVYQLVGPSTFGFHLINVLLHALNACLLYRFGRRLRFNQTALFFAVLIWALHPVQVEVIAYASATADALFVSFLLMGMNIIVPRFGPKQIALSVPFLILGLLSKEEAVVFPLCAISAFFLLHNDRHRWRAYIRFWPLALTDIFYAIVHKYFLTFGDFKIYQQNDIYSQSILCRIYTFLGTIPHYLGFLIAPVHLHFDRNFEPITSPWNISVIAGAVVVGLMALQITQGLSRRALALSFGFLWFAAAHSIHTGIMMPMNALLLEHWLYLPSAGLFIGTAQSLASVKWQRKQRKPFEIIFFLGLALVLGCMTHKQTQTWSDPETFYLNIFKNGEPSPHAHNNLAIIYTLQHRYAEAIEHYELSIELSGDRNPQAQHDLAITLLLGPDGERYTQEATRHLERALEIDPNYYPADEALSELAKNAGNSEQATYYAQKAEAAHAKMIGQ